MSGQGTVSAFGCGRAHPQLGEKAACTRARAHAGDHRSEYDGRLCSWPDAPLPEAPLLLPRLETPRLATVELEGQLDESTELWSEPVRVRDAARDPVWLVLVLVLVVVLLAAPPALMILWRLAL